jgi:steroid 5-alpha reductase family enzyme
MFYGLAAAGALSFAMALAWLVRLRSGRSGWIDTIWSAATGLVAFVLALAPGSGAALAAPCGRRALAAGLIAVWAARLAGHIFARTRGAGEDPRYAALAQEWGADFPLRLFVFLQIQAAAALPLVAAVALAARAPRPFPDVFDLAGVVVSAAALCGEALADAQLAQFRRAAPSGGICEIGLWKYSRHPNYFFEFLFWCAWPLLALDFSGAFPQGLLALAAPAFIYWLLVHVSGVPPLEKHMLASRGAAFEAYTRRINVFFPGPRRNSPDG